MLEPIFARHSVCSDNAVIQNGANVCGGRCKVVFHALSQFAFAVLAMDLGSDGLMYSKVRLMLPAFPLLIPVAMGLAHRRRTTAVCSAALIVCFGAWFGAYSLTAWPYAI